MKSFLRRLFALIILAGSAFIAYTASTGAWDRTPYLDKLERDIKAIGGVEHELVDMVVVWRHGWVVNWLETGERKEGEQVVQYLVLSGGHPVIVYRTGADQTMRRVASTEDEYTTVLKLLNDFQRVNKQSYVAVEREAWLDDAEQDLRNNGFDIEPDGTSENDSEE